MAQQTQISRVDEAWVAFMRRFPDPRALAAASVADVLRAWAGLGYNRRAVALHRTARIIASEHGGLVPDDIETLESLPGIGPYTARAVAAVAFGRPVAAVDTNVRRVVTRLVGRSLSARDLQDTADRLVAADDPAAWTHATMDLGATVCRIRQPACDECPVSRWCDSEGTSGRVATAGTGASVPTRKELRFELTTRWLRGRIVERLREDRDGRWVRLPDGIGQHRGESIEAAVVQLERDGLLERRSDGAVRLPSDPR